MGFNDYLAVLMFVTFIALVFSGFPIAWLLGGIAVIFTAISVTADTVFLDAVLAAFPDYWEGDLTWIRASLVVNNIWEQMRNWVLVALPMFIFMGLMLDRSGIAETLMDNFVQLFGRVRGGYAVTITLIGVLLAASTGIIGASVVLLTLLGLPVMLKNNYSKELAVGTCSAVGTLGILIPPSIMLVLMADKLAMSVGDLFMGALIPGIILGVLYIVFILVIALIRPGMAPAPVDSQPMNSEEFEISLRTILAAAILLLIYVLISFGLLSRPMALGIGFAFAVGLLLGSNWFLGKAGWALLPSAALIVGVSAAIVLNILDPMTAFIAGLFGAYLLLFLSSVLIRRISVPLWPLVGIPAAALLSIFLWGREPATALVIATIAANLLLLSITGLLAKVFWAVMPPALLILAVLGSIFFGVATPTEASGVGAFGATLLAAANRKLSIAVLRDVVRETTKTTAFIFAIILGAIAFALVLRNLGGDELIERTLIGMDLGALGTVLVILAIVFVLGFILDWIQIILIILPLVGPIIADMAFDLGFDSSTQALVWFTVLFAVVLQTSFLTPPVGYALFYVKGVAPPEISVKHIYRGVLPFIVLQLIGATLIFLWPEVVTWLPRTMYAQ